MHKLTMIHIFLQHLSTFINVNNAMLVYSEVIHFNRHNIDLKNVQYTLKNAGLF